MSDKPKRRFTLEQRLKCVEREIALRANVYPGKVARKTMRQAEADYEIACMQAIRGMLKLLIGANVPEDLPQPSDLFAALIHVNQIAAEMPAGKEVEAIEAIRKVAGYALRGVPIAAPKPKEETQQ